MKKLFSLVSILSIALCAFAQSPYKFNYQAVIRNSDGTLKANQNINIQIGLIQGSANGTTVYIELHAVQTNAQGIVNLQVGNGTVVSGSMDSIAWNHGPYFIKLWVDGIEMGASEILSVPYALYAGKTSQSDQLAVIPNSTLSPDSALFVVKDRMGNPVFAVYETGVIITFDEGTKGGQAGFAVGGRHPVKNGIVDDIFKATQDSVLIFINDQVTKGGLGGFAVGGRPPVKGMGINYLRVTPDSTRIITVDTLKGFGVSNLSSEGTLGYLRLTPTNYFIGQQSGNKITTGIYNSVLGYQSGYSLNTGSSNSFMGYKAGNANTSGNYNVFIGNQAGFSNMQGSMNTFVGFIAGQNNTTGYYNTFIGDSAGFSNIDGPDNTYLGGKAGFSNKYGQFNTAIGAQALYSSIYGKYEVAVGAFALESDSGEDNVAIGYRALNQNRAGYGNLANGSRALYSNTYGNLNVANGCLTLAMNSIGTNNVANGYAALRNNTSGDGNVAEGGSALYSNTTGSCNTAIGSDADVSANNLTNATAIGFSVKVTASNNMVFGNNNVVGWGFGVAPGSAAIRIGTSASNGNGATLTLSGVWTNASDSSKKYGITGIKYGINEVMKLRPVTYKLKGSNQQDIGFIAQDVKKIIPEIVYGEDGNMTLSYGQITSILTKAIQEQQQQIESLQSEINQLKDQVAKATRAK